MINEINRYIEHTVLSAFATEADVERICEEAKNYEFASVCINPMYVKKASELLKGSEVNVCTVIGFPLGANATSTKVAEVEQAYRDGCAEFDMVIAVGALKEGRYDYVEADIAAVVKAAQGKTVKVIIETAYLTDEEKVTACRLAAKAGAHFVKTCTGFSNAKDAPNKATVHDITLMRAHITRDMKVKASGGIRSYEDAVALVKAGADRLGTSSGVKIMEG
jgi:deoxyribose-phosphate aldolase